MMKERDIKDMNKEQFVEYLREQSEYMIEIANDIEDGADQEKISAILYLDLGPINQWMGGELVE